MIFKKRGTAINFLVYGFSLAVLLLFLQLIRFRFLLVEHATELYTTAIAVLFTGLGIWLGLKLVKPKTVKVVETITVEKEVVKKDAEPFVLNSTEIEKLGLTEREMEVLQLMAEGLSNQEIGERLFLSVHTIKTHCSNLFEKLDVKRRTQAVEKAKRLQLIA